MLYYQVSHSARPRCPAAARPGGALRYIEAYLHSYMILAISKLIHCLCYNKLIYIILGMINEHYFNASL